MKTNSLMAALFFVAAQIFCLPVRAQQGQTAAPSIVLSEVCYLPQAGESEWIELANFSERAVDLKGWQLLDGQALDFVITENSFVLPPGGYLVVRLDGSALPIAPVAPGSWVAHSPRGTVGNLLGDKGGHIALYAPEIDVFNPAKIQSYVAWGRSPGAIVAEALEAQQWSMAEQTVLGTGPDVILGPAKTLRPGGTIALVESPAHWGYKHGHWGVFSPSEANPGETGFARRGPVLTHYAYDGATTDIEGYSNISVVPMEEGVEYQFQVCSDKKCADVFLDRVGTNFDYRIEKPIPRHSTYFWRARLIYPDGTQSRWSEIRRLIRE